MYSQRSSWAMSSLIVTLSVIVAILGIAAYFFFGAPDNGKIVAVIIIGVLAVMCLTALFFFPLQTQVDKDGLNIAFSLRNKTIPLSKIKSAAPYQVTMNFVRVCGSGAFFGWWGLYRNQELGRFMVYAANLDNTILVELTDGKKYVISCSDPIAMSQAILGAKDS